MTRTTKRWLNQPELPPTDTPIVPARDFSEDDAGYWGCDTGKKAREKSLYKKGDVIPFDNGREIVPAAIVNVHAEYLSIAGYWIPAYRVVTLTKRGTWSTAWRRTWPGLIDGAYERTAQT